MKRTFMTNVWVYALLLVGCGAVQSQSVPAIEQMTLAQPSAKASVPVDVRYQLRAAPARDQPVALELAFVARIAGRNLNVEFPRGDAVTIESGGASFAQQKAEVDGVVRRSLIVTPRAERGTVRVLVSMDIEGTRSFGVFSIPIHLER
ncbi:MAG TPA: hypothetical protein VFV69_13585 [Steroidobacteraceae bacterium]|jgi:hypothetical protein|nr:hypothetical protein [Steroidobacteraceae bacterium]